MKNKTYSSLTFATLVDRIAGDGIDAWELHNLGVRRKKAGEDIVILSIGEDVGSTTPAPIVDAAIDSLQSGEHHYAPLAGTQPLLERIAAHHTRSTGQSLSTQNVVAFAGAQNALFAVALCLIETGDDVVVIEPFYTTYPATFSASGANLVRVTASPDNDFIPDLHQIEAVLTPATRMVVINSPHNPTGVIYPKSFMQAVAQLCRERGIWLLSDEVYSQFTFGETHHSPARLFDIDEGCVVVSSLSKSHLMSGWRIGWATGPAALCKRLTDLVLCMNYGLPLFIQTAACTAFDMPQQVVTENVDRYASRAKFVTEALGDIDAIELTPPKAGMFVMLSVKQTGMTASAFAHKVLDDHGVCLLPCDGFGRGLEHHIRMSLCAEIEPLARATQAIKSVALGL